MKKEILEGILRECKEDFVGLWVILWEVKNEYPQKSAEEQRDVAMDLVKTLLEDDEIVVGQFTKDRQFLPWNLSQEQAFAKIKEEWAQLGAEPSLGDIAWFTSRGPVQSFSAAGRR